MGDLPKRALEGIRIIDCSTIVAAPSCTQMLGDHGAEIIKVESPNGDDGRRLGTPTEIGVSAHFLGLNRNKRSVGLDLETEEGREVLLRLLEDADVLLENFKPNTLEKWGIGYEDYLKKRFPKLIHGHITGFGANGPLGGLPGYDAIAQGFAGIMSFTGEKEGDPLRLSLNAVDTSAGLYLNGAIAMALFERTRSGLGQSIEVTLLDTSLTMIHPFAANWIHYGKEPERMGSRHPNAAPYDVYPAADGHVLVCVANDRHFKKLCELMGHPEVAADPRFAKNADRVANIDEMSETLAAMFADKKKVDISMMCLEGGVAVAPVMTVPEALDHPQVAAREMIIEDGAYKAIGIPVKMSRTPGRMSRIPPKYAEHNQEVLTEAGYSSEEISRLTEKGILREKTT